MDARYLLGWWHLHRYQVLPVDERQVELDRVFAVWGPLMISDPERFPPKIVRYHETFVDPTDKAIDLFRRFERTGHLPELEEAVIFFRVIVTTTLADDPDLGMHLSNLGGALQARFERTGDTANLDEVIKVGRRAVDVTPAGHPEFSGRLNNLGNALRIRFKRTGDAASLDEAIVALRRAVDVIPVGDADIGAMLSNLGGALQARFERSGDAASLDEAIVALRRAVDVIPVGDADIGAMLSNLGGALQARFERSGDAASLDEAIVALRRAVDAIHADDADIGAMLSNLGGALQARFERSGDAASLDEAIVALRRAVDAIHADDADIGAMLSNLGSTLQTRFKQTGDAASLDEAIDALRRAVDATSADHPKLSGMLFNLGNALRTRFERFGGTEVLAECRRRYAQAWAGRSGPVDVRVAAARRAADMDLIAGDGKHALVMAERGVELLGLLAPRRLQRVDRQHRVTSLAGLASTVATAAIAAGRPDTAVELLEQARGLLITDTLDTRGDLTVLHHHAPDLAAEFTALRDALDTLDHATAPLPTPSSPKQRGYLLAAWEQLLDRIRAIPDLADFLLPPSLQHLRKAADEGPIVYLVTHRHASHALIVTNNPHQSVRALPLFDLTPTNTADHIDLLREAQHTANNPRRSARDRVIARRRIHQTLGWIWDTIAEPVLTHLGHTVTPADNEPWPRIWWCPVGLATFLPLHAAGHHLTTTDTVAHSNDTVFDRVISSYTPTARALLHTAPGTDATGVPSTVIIAVPDADPHPDIPTQPDLPGVKREVANLRVLIPTATTLPALGQAATRDTVLNGLSNHNIAHFACHGLADWANPAQSRLILHDHHTHPLTLNHITALRLTDARLAYLSACSTTNTNPAHADEATHLTAAFQLAGYTSVIGTIWTINDHTATAITRNFYSRLTGKGTKPPDTRLAAHALHCTIRALRNAKPMLPDHWAAHIHAGR
ncbi:CHAT domain-containing protein [Lentzea alba]|uniref:CHAT domain-containing protein n=1 Tax=Lentzea alba TaxID=2714351 RepID=UPI0039BED0AA